MYILFLDLLLVIIDCFVSLAMIAHTNSSLRELLATRGNLIYFGLVIARLWKSRGNLGMATTTHNQNFSLWRPKACSNLSMGHQGTQPPLSLREPKVRGNLGIGYNYSIDEFFSFLFLYLLLVVNSFSFLFFVFFILVYVIDCEFFLFFIKEEISSSCGLLRFTRNDSTPTPSLREFVELVAISLWQQPHPIHQCHCENRRFVAISVWGTIIHSYNSFVFCFCINY